MKQEFNSSNIYGKEERGWESRRDKYYWPCSITRFFLKNRAFHSKYRYTNEVLGFVVPRLSLLPCFVKFKLLLSISLNIANLFAMRSLLYFPYTWIDAFSSRSWGISETVFRRPRIMAALCPDYLTSFCTFSYVVSFSPQVQQTPCHFRRSGSEWYAVGHHILCC